MEWNGIRWNISKTYRGIPGSIPRGTTFGQCACLYARTELVAHIWWIENQCEKKNEIDFISYYRFILNSLISSQPIKIIFLIRHINLMLKIGRKKNQIKSLLIFNISDLYSKYLTHLIVLFSFYLFFIN
jgi:hypothetical protein